MKNKISTIIAFAFTLYANAQSNPTGNPPSNNINAQANAAWYRGVFKCTANLKTVRSGFVNRNRN